MLLDKTSQQKQFNQNQNTTFNLIEYDNFCNSFIDGYAPYIKIKKNPGLPKQVSTCKYGQITLNQRIKHLTGQEMTGGRGKWYPVFMIFDIDTQNLTQSPESVVEGIKSDLNLKDNQYVLSGSLSYNEKRNAHLYIRPEINNKTRCLKRDRYKLLPIADKYKVELYPQAWRKICEPCSPYQPIIDDSLKVIQSDWTKMIKEYNSIEPVDLSGISQLDFDFNIDDKKYKPVSNNIYIPIKDKTEQLIKYGLQNKGTRHFAIVDLACYYSVSKNVLPSQAQRMIFKWIKAKHNGQSKSINAGMNDIELKNEIASAVQWAYTKYMRIESTPTPVHNLGYGIAQSHIDFIASIFPADIVNQNRLFKLLCFYNPRGHWNYVNIHNKIWYQIAGRQYKHFQILLKYKGILSEPKHNIYIPGYQAKQFHLQGIKQDKNFIAYDDRNLTNFHQVMQGQSTEYLKTRLRLSRKAVYRIKQYRFKDITLNDFIQ